MSQQIMTQQQQPGQPGQPGQPSQQQQPGQMMNPMMQQQQQGHYQMAHQSNQMRVLTPQGQQMQPAPQYNVIIFKFELWIYVKV